MDEKGREGIRSVVGKAVDTAILPLQVAVSKPAQKAYIGTALFALTSFVLLCLSTTAYWLFYYSYVPQVGIEKVIHLQFGDGHPFGTTSLSSALTSQQAYEVTLFLNLPRTPNNIAAGNFMIDVSLYGSSQTNIIDNLSSLGGNTTLAHSRRPAIMTYTSNVVDKASTVVSLPWYVLGWKRESEALRIVMFEAVEFARRSTNIPDTVKVVVEADKKMQFYEAGIQIVARFDGLRWIMYHHRIISFFVFTAVFWTSSMISMGMVWILLMAYNAEPAVKEEDSVSVKQESDVFDPTSLEDISDTSRTFPTGRGRAPLHFSSGKGKYEGDIDIKQEEDQFTTMPGFANEADDEDEDERDGSEWRDSGIGGSREEGRRDVRRRKRLSVGT